jgi:DNA-binding transcriptional regulator YiaG
MLNHSYTTAVDSSLRQPKFTPGLDYKTTGIPFIAGTTLVLASISWQPSNQNSSDFATYENKPNQLLIIDQAPRIIEEKNTTDSTTIPYSAYASLVSSALGLGKSDIARILGVSRPTLYSWIKGNSEPRESNHPERLRTLGELVREICGETERPLYHRFVEEPLPGETNSILSLLLAKKWGSERLQQLLAEALRLTTERDQLLGHAIPVKTSRSRQESNLLDNSIASNLE